MPHIQAMSVPLWGLVIFMGWTIASVCLLLTVRIRHLATGGAVKDFGTQNDASLLWRLYRVQANLVENLPLYLGKEVIVIKSDAGQVGEQKHLAEEIAKVFDKLDAVFLNAGIGIFQPIEAWDEATFDNQIEVNFKDPFFLIQSLLPILANPASIVLNTSI